MADDPSNTQKALALAAGTIPGILARIYGPNANSNVPPELRQLLAQQTQRSAYQNPLFEAVTGQALSGLPDYAKAGHTLGPSMGTAVPPVSGGGLGVGGALAAGAAGAGLGSLLGPGSGGNLPLQQLINALKKLFAGGRDTVQGNKPNAGGAMTGGGQGMPDWFNGWANDPMVGPQQSDPFLFSDPGSWYGQGGEGASPTDPSGGTGVGPGMQDFRNGGGAGTPPGEEGSWWDE